MEIITWPASIKTGAVDYGIEWDVQISVYRNGRITTYGLPGASWTASIRFENDWEAMTRPLIESMLVRLRGGANRLSMPHFGRPIPNGTLRGNPTIATTLAAGAKSIQMTNCNGGVKAGDILGLPGQLVMVVADASPSFTNMIVQVSPDVRASHNSGTPVTWNRPTTLWIPRSAISGPFPYAANGYRPGFSVDFVEAPT